MTTKVVPLLLLLLASPASFSGAAEANTDYAAADKAAKQAEAAVAPAKAAAEQAVAAHTAAGKEAAAKRQDLTIWDTAAAGLFFDICFLANARDCLE